MHAVGSIQSREPSNFSKNDGKHLKRAITDTHCFPERGQNNVDAQVFNLLNSTKASRYLSLNSADQQTNLNFPP
jgi:hypothetical protein